MAATSSTKKAAKLAGRNSGRTVQFQGGSVFPIALLLVIVLGVASIVYARQTIPGAGDGAPVTPISEYYDVAYGINICGDWVTISDGDAELNADGRIDYASYRETGVYQYGEGVATVHPYAAELADVSLDLSSLLDVHGITIADDALTFPEDQLDGAVYTRARQPVTLTALKLMLTSQSLSGSPQTTRPQAIATSQRWVRSRLMPTDSSSQSRSSHGVIQWRSQPQ